LAGAFSIVILFQSASSSSATIAARPVCVPWPISWCLLTTVTQPCASILMNGPKAPGSICLAPALRIVEAIVPGPTT
jgi:hypothetical protein